MATVDLHGETNRELLPDQSDLQRRFDAATPDVTEPLPPSGGLFLVEQCLLKPQELETVVTDVKSYRPDEHPTSGVITYNEAHLSNGFYHRVIEGNPKHPRTRMKVDIGTPWICDAEGFIEHFGRKALDMGIAFRIIGSEQYQVGLPTPWNIGKAWSHCWDNISLTQSAHDVLLIMEATDEGTGRYVNVGESFLVGASRPAMYEAALQIMADDFGRRIHWSEAIDPGVAGPIDLLHPEVSLAHFAAEGAALVGVGKRILGSPLRYHYGKTFNKSIDSIIPQAATWDTLSSGDGGRLAELTPEGRQRLVTLYVMSLALSDGYHSIYGYGHDGTHIVDLHGGHMSIPDIWPLLEQRFELILTELKAHDDDPTEVDYEKVKRLATKQALELEMAAKPKKARAKAA